MNFTKQSIPGKTLCIVDVGTYKIRVCAAQFKNNHVEVLGYFEKRQDASYFANQECLNIPGLCQNIIEAIEHLEKQIEHQLPEIILNYPFGEIFLASKKINYRRKHPLIPINNEELDDIVETVERICLSSLAGDIDRLYGLSQKEVQILLGRVNSVSIDGDIQSKIVGHEGEDIKFSLLNAFIPLSKHQLINQIGNALEKKIYRILPTEYCITKVFPDQNIVVINVGATQTTISVKVDDEILGITKIPIGMSDLISKISKQHQTPRAQVIEELNSHLYEKEKSDFLSIWGESVGIGLKEILAESICPQKFYLGGGGGNNDFIKDCIAHLELNNYDIRSFHNTIQFTSGDITSILEPISHISVGDVETIPLDIYVLLLEANNIIAQSRDTMSVSLQHAIEKLGYIRS